MPYQPNIEYRGDQYLFQGISQAGDAVKGAIKQWKDERKDAKATAKTLEAVGSGLSGLVEAGLLPPGMLKQYAQVQGAPASEQKAFLQGTGEVFRMFQQMEQAKGETAKLKMAAEQLGLAKESQALDTKKTEALLDTQTQQKAAGSRIAEFLTERPGMAVNLDASGRAFKTPQPGTKPAMVGGKPAGELTPEAVARLGGNALTPEGFTQLAVAAQRGDRQPRVVTLPTSKGPVEGIWDGANWKSIAGETATDANNPIIVKDAQGNPLFYGLSDGKGGLTWKDPKEKGVRVEAVPGMRGLIMVNGAPIKLDAKNEAIWELLPPAGSDAPAAPAAKPASSGTVERRTINPQGVRVR